MQEPNSGRVCSGPSANEPPVAPAHEPAARRARLSEP
eukprot:CAMPEP_0197908526 /NCGR_PEP_ID=MMETSP1439-20131203/66983_1 /TAXON_ID=66791 /ORGANISM="Gonyaulax spinifera, Strain CCMP409" /LENGTH=36 /DNA_ID= /DNA_START= /DNA_END= /DNA_ORIENTATION=